MTERLSPEDRADARRIFQAAGEGGRVCSFCGGIHMRACPRVAEFELYQDGKLKRVRFWTDGEWKDSDIIWPEMAFDDDEERSGNE